MFSDCELMRMHAAALFTHDDRLRLLFVNKPGNIRAPRFYLGRTLEGNLWRFRADLPSSLTERLEALCEDEPVTGDLREAPRHAKEYISLLEAHSPIEKQWAGPVYSFPEGVATISTNAVIITEENACLLNNGLEDWLEDVPHSSPFMATVKDNRAVAVCCSVRITSEAHEAGVETLIAHRQRGYASDVVVGWANAVRDMGCTPLYSTSWDNVASQNVAGKLGLIQFGADFHLT